MRFYGIDGDKIGRIIESYMIDGEIDALSKFSAKVASALEEIKNNVIHDNGTIVFCAGDSILFQGSFEVSWCENILDLFLTLTGCTASMGVGKTPTEAYLALKQAKAKGGGKVVQYPALKGVAMTRPLLVFIGSSNVGPYINVMANSVDKHDVDRIALINVLESPSGQQVDFADFANRVLWDTLSGLVEGKYKDRGQEFPIPKDCEAYKKLKHIFGNSHELQTVNYQFLRDGVEKLKNIYGSDAIVDVSGVPKRVAIDILTACLAVGISNVMLFELKKPIGGVQALYHALKETDYEHVVLPNWEPLLGNLEFFSARQNRQKLWTVVAAILISLFLTVLYQLGRIQLGDGSWFLVGAIVLFGFFGGIVPIVDAWGGIRLIRIGGRRRRI